MPIAVLPSIRLVEAGVLPRMGRQFDGVSRSAAGRAEAMVQSDSITAATVISPIAWRGEVLCLSHAVSVIIMKIARSAIEEKPFDDFSSHVECRAISLLSPATDVLSGVD